MLEQFLKIRKPLLLQQWQPGNSRNLRKAWLIDVARVSLRKLFFWKKLKTLKPELLLKKHA